MRDVGKGLPQAKVAKRLTQSQFVFGQVEVLSLALYDDLHKTLTISFDYAPVRPHGVYFLPFPPIESKACFEDHREGVNIATRSAVDA